MALNLGIYSADLSFASMFDQSQASINYLTATKKLAENIGILNAVENSTIKRMEGNINNRDSLMEIISETLMNSNSFLKENDRAEVAALILTGSWVEGLYIAVKIAETTEENDELIQRIIDQRLSLKTLSQLLDSYKESNDVATVITDLENITALFEKVEVAGSKTEVVKDENGKTILKNSTTATLAPEEFAKLSSVVTELRSKMTNN
jgi:putative ubiquitin-RnfH superfamily antitoxin RatB of RatAB toxin-antitoxin module